MTELDIGKVVTGLPVPPTDGAALNDWVYTLSRAIIAAHTAKLLAGVEMPEPVDFGFYLPMADSSGNPIWEQQFAFTLEQLQAYAYAAALNARREALEEALNCYSPDDSATDWANKIEALKEKV